MNRTITYQNNSWQVRPAGAQITKDGMTTLAVNFWCQAQDAEITERVPGTLVDFQKVSDESLTTSLKAGLEAHPLKSSRG